MSGLTGELSVLVHRCTHLKSSTLFTKQSPFVELIVGTVKQSTSVHSKAGNQAEFNEFCRFPIVPACETLTIRVKHAGTFSNDTIGRADVNLIRLLSRGVGHHCVHWIRIFDPDNYAKQSGCVGLSVEFAGNGMTAINSMPFNVTQQSISYDPAFASAPVSDVIDAPPAYEEIDTSQHAMEGQHLQQQQSNQQLINNTSFYQPPYPSTTSSTTG